MSAPQKFASAMTFAKRYAFCNAFGILTSDEDVDANGSEDEKEEQRYKKLLEEIEKCDRGSLLQYRNKLIDSKKYSESHKKVIIPGYVSVLSGKLEEVSGWKVSVGPRELRGSLAQQRQRNWYSPVR